MLWLWSRQAATAPIGPLAWEPPYAASAVLKRPKKKKKKKKKERTLIILFAFLKMSEELEVEAAVNNIFCDLFVNIHEQTLISNQPGKVRWLQINKMTTQILYVLN